MKTIRVRIDEGFNGPALSEVMGLIHPDVPTEVRWEGSRSDYWALESLESPNLVLVIKSQQVLESTCTSLGLPYGFSPSFVEEAGKLLSNRSTSREWRVFVSNNGGNVSRGLLTNLIGDEIRKGHRPKLSKLVSSCWTEDIRVTDIDILFDLMEM